MSFKVTIKEVSIESVKKGKNSYSKAVVAYDYQGNARKQTLVSFSNPGVFAVVQDLKPGDVVDVDVTKDGEYTQWSKVSKAGEEGSKDVATPERPKSVSTYETAQERAENRVRIVRQSSLSNAINTLGGVSTGTTVPEILDLAQAYFDWVYAEEDHSDTPD